MTPPLFVCRALESRRVDFVSLILCAHSSTANRHTLRALAEAGGGAFEFFDVKTKHNWAEKASRRTFNEPHTFKRDLSMSEDEIFLYLRPIPKLYQNS